MAQNDLELNKQNSVDAGLLEVVIALAALSVAIAALPLQVPNLVIEFMEFPILISAIITFVLSYFAFGDLYAAYLAERGLRFSGWWFGREKRMFGKFRSNPYLELWLATRSFGISLILLLVGIILEWILGLPAA